MPLPRNNLYPDFNISRLSHIELGVKDLEASFAFYVETLGLQVTEKESNYIYLRGMEERGHHSVILKKSEEPTCNVLGYKVFDEKNETFFKYKPFKKIKKSLDLKIKKDNPFEALKQLDLK